MAERQAGVAYLEINGSGNIASQCQTVPVIDRGVNTINLMPQNTDHAKTGGFVKNGTFSVEVRADPTLVDAFLAESILGTEVMVKVQETLAMGETAGTATNNSPVDEATCFVSSLPAYPSGGPDAPAVWVINWPINAFETKTS